ncbi:uncharacterized protein LOC129733988 [Wyeomyia smithii]|uniref:uncharacterized protein LOC129733988 n=1 Tax=Wyeomyia smithii TaxID=174621 RepID=UPI0024681B14|nr:uncharacterized protein LOC129733988 [Wyeomyia smithii]XP_055551621.1 uncharacterized protein LOC129733988 [Wyeomyia smithii]XP_055551622.1 uncharacterized protein LOC129733988 [Wyeomyia smithii]
MEVDEESTFSTRWLQLCPFRGVSSKSTIVDESEEFPEPVDPFGHLVEEDEPSDQKKCSYLRLYLDECRKYGVTPLGYVCGILLKLDEGIEGMMEVDLNRFGCSNLQVQIVLDCLAQACPDRLTALNLDHNLLMNCALTLSVAGFLQASRSIIELSLTNCSLSDVEAVKVLAEALSTSSVQRLNLANCQLGDAGGAALFRGMTLSDSIQVIDVSWNRLEHEAGFAAGQFLAGNTTLQELILKGNRLYLEKECIVPFLKELTKNETLKKLNLAWNALQGASFAQALYKALNGSAVGVINLEMNCFRSEEAMALLKVFRKCETLREIYLGGNFFAVDEIKELVKAFAKNPGLKVLSLGEYQFVSKVTARLSKRFMNRDTSKQITFGGILLANPPAPVDVPEMLLDRCRFLGFKPKKKKRKKDLGHLMLQLQHLDEPLLTREDFTAAVKKFRIKLDKSLMGSLMDAFADRKLVDIGAMASKYLEKYPTEPPPVKQKKKKSSKGRKKNGKSKKF